MVDKNGNPIVKDGKKKIIKISGKGKLTDKYLWISDKKKYYYNLYAMKKVVWAILHHCTALVNDKFSHQFCPP